MKLRLTVVLCLLALTACVSPAPQARIRISTGERLVVNLRDGTVEGSHSKFAKVLGARFMINAQTKNGLYDIAVAFAPGVQPASIRVEDVTDEKAVLLIQDDAPQLFENNAWRKASPPVDFESDSMKWIHHIDDSFRVYSFDITLKDGQKIVLRQASIYLGFFKQGMMQTINPDKNKP